MKSLKLPSDHFDVVMGGIENFLSRLLKDNIPRYHSILPYSGFHIIEIYKISIFIMSDEKYLLR